MGALLRPAAVPHLVSEPARLRDDERAVELPDLAEPVRRAMTMGADRHRLAVEAFTTWLVATVPAPTPEAVAANVMVDLIETDETIRTVADVAERLNVSLRTVQRMARRYVGLSPLQMIRRRRLQQAAERLRSDPDTTLATVAAELGCVDHAHLANEFRTVLGITPSNYRQRSRLTSAKPSF